MSAGPVAHTLESDNVSGDAADGLRREKLRMRADPISAGDLGDTPVLDTIVRMHEGTRERSGLDDETYMLVRIAALVATDAAPVSYFVNLGVVDELDLDDDKIIGTLVAVAPVIGSARTASAASKMIRAGLLGTSLTEAVGHRQGH